MKKIAWFLLLTVLLSVFATACSNDEVGESSVTEQSVSEPVSSDPAESSEVTDVKRPVREDAYMTVISTGASYTKSIEADDAYPDTYKTELTDGILLDENSDNYFDECLSGYTILGKELRIVVDLGNVYDEIVGFRAGYLATTSAGINEPSYVRVQYSLDGEDWSRSVILNKEPFENGTRKQAEKILDNYASARYVRFIICGMGHWTFLDEVQVLADVEPTDINAEYAEVIKAVYSSIGAPASPATGVAVDRSLYPVLVSRGAEYTVEGETDPTFPNENGMLTDGEMSGVYEGGTWVGFKGGQEVKITVDLGAVVSDIATLQVKCYTNVGIGTYLPAAVRFVAIDESGNRTELGNVFASSVTSVGAYTFSLPLSGAVSAKYVEFTLVETETKIILVEECAVYAYRDYDDSGMYPDVVLDKTSKGNWPNASSKYEDLLLGLGQQISTIADPGLAYHNDHHNTPITSRLLTDGQTTTGTDFHGGRFFKFFSGTGRNIYYDLGYVSAVDKFTAGFIDYPSWAVHAPGAITVAVSVDGENWYEAGTIVIEGKENTVIRGQLQLKKKVKARYIVFSFAVKGWAGCDELQAFGTKSVSGASDPSKAGLNKYNLYTGKYMAPTPEILNGNSDLVLLYNSGQNSYTVDDLIPYVAYVDKDGKIIDTMFDSFLFLAGSLPSGHKSYADVDMADCQWNIDDVFTEGENIYALEEAAGRVKSELGLDDGFKYGVTMTIMYPSWERKSFGDVDGDGVSEDLTVYENRVKVVKWYIDAIEKRFASAGFKNLELVGYYWMNEDITVSDPDALRLSNDIAKLCHDVGKSYFWIPYFTAVGYDLWSQYGFDVACMQPNYVFKAATPITNLTSCAKLTALYNMGIEIEICEESIFDELFFNKYMSYLAYGTTYGYMNEAIHMYYQGSYIFRDAAYSDNYMGRKAYESTYEFIKHKLKTTPDPIDVPVYESNKNEVFTGSFGFDNDIMRLLRIETAADHGSVTTNDDGTFCYYPEKDYTGPVKFSFAYSEYLGWSEPIEVTVNVK